MAKLRCSSSSRNRKQLGGTELFISTLMSLFGIGAWGVRRRSRRARMIRSGSRRRRRGGCGCGCFVILFLVPVIILVIVYIFFRVEIVEFIYDLIGIRLRLP